MTNATTYSQPTKTPTQKVKAGILAGKVVTVLFGIVAIVYPELFERIPAGFEMAVGGLITSIVVDVAAYFTKERV
jgi:hypothetical protein